MSEFEVIGTIAIIVFSAILIFAFINWAFPDFHNKKQLFKNKNNDKI